VLSVIVVADLTAGTGRFNLAQGAVGALSGLAAAVSTLATGYLAKLLGVTAGYIAIAVCAFGAVALLWVFLTETKPEKYD